MVCVFPAWSGLGAGSVSGGQLDRRRRRTTGARVGRIFVFRGSPGQDSSAQELRRVPPANGRPAFRHDDLMIVYRDETTRALRATYFDSERHVIQYTVKPAEGGVVFVSEGAPSSPRFRMTYTSTGKDTLNIKFEIAAPGKEFAPYLEAAAHRDGARK